MMTDQPMTGAEFKRWAGTDERNETLQQYLHAFVEEREDLAGKPVLFRGIGWLRF